MDDVLSVFTRTHVHVRKCTGLIFMTHNSADLSQGTAPKSAFKARVTQGVIQRVYFVEHQVARWIRDRRRLCEKKKLKQCDFKN